MELSAVKRLIVENLKKRKFRLYTKRFDIVDKNKLYTRGVTVNFVLDKIDQCKKGNYHTEFYLDADDNIAHVFIKDRWYFKFCLIDGVVNIVSVHKEEQNA